MKIIISESKIYVLIDRFLTDQFESHKELKLNNNLYWIKNNQIIAEFEKMSFWVHRNIYDSMQYLFSIDDVNRLDSYISRWLMAHHNKSGYKIKRADLLTQSWDDLLYNLQRNN